MTTDESSTVACFSLGVLGSDGVMCRLIGSSAEQLIGGVSLIDGSGLNSLHGTKRTIKNGWRTIRLDDKYTVVQCREASCDRLVIPWQRK